MSLRSRLVLRKVGRLISGGENENAVGKALTEAIDRSPVPDDRLILQHAVVTGSTRGLYDLCAKDSSNRAVAFHLALMEYKKGSIPEAASVIKKAAIRDGDNRGLAILRKLIEFRASGDISILTGLGSRLVTGVSSALALVLFEVENAIVANDPDDRGAKERETGMGGFFGWMFDRLDDMAIWIYWTLSRVKHFFLKPADDSLAKAGSRVIRAERLEGLGKIDQARSDYEKAVEYDPENETALRALIFYYMDKDDYDTAEKHLSAFAKIPDRSDERDPLMDVWRAEILFARGRYDEASLIYDKVKDDFPLSYIIRYKRGLCGLRAGEAEMAITGFKAALELPNPCLISERLEKLTRFHSSG